MNLWYTEENPEASLRWGFRVSKTLFSQKSEFQQVDVYETTAYGRLLTLDGYVMITDVDEFVYHEMISHIPLCLHKKPEHVIVIGGGDGGTVREVLRHPCVKSVVLCEIDEMVVSASKEFFPAVAGKLSDPRVTVRIGDGVAYMQELKAAADVIIVDSTDPIGPGEGLFSGAFYQSVAAALKPGGLMVAQSECPWYDAPVLNRIQNNISKGFKHVRPYIGGVPTYPRGSWTWTLGAQESLGPELLDMERFSALGKMQYLTPDLAKATFALPQFLLDKLAQK